MWRFIVQSNLLMFYFFWPVSIIGQNDNQNVLLGSKLQVCAQDPGN